ncbi:hypothetical protein DQG13_28630 [Paenibacillus sp. YN15]|nr:hypothetical protein DQG13_28630 [Paenibacillus sp. YN15]
MAGRAEQTGDWAADRLFDHIIANKMIFRGFSTIFSEKGLTFDFTAWYINTRLFERASLKRKKKRN